MGLRPSTLPRCCQRTNELLLKYLQRMLSVGIGTISIFDGACGCLDCRLSSTSGVMSHNMSSDATVRTAAGTSLTDKWTLTS